MFASVLINVNTLSTQLDVTINRGDDRGIRKSHYLTG